MHRDLKPHNILIGHHGETLVADWGLACPDLLPPEPVVGAPLPTVEWPAAHLADVGVSGTLMAMSPEQARGEPLDRRADVYALGVIFYEILTGERPFAWRTLKEAAAPRPLPERPRVRAPEREIPTELEGLCLRCLQPRREDRFGGAGELAAAVEAALTGARRRQQAIALTAEAKKAHERMAALTVERAALVKAQAELEAVIKPWDDEKTKGPLWAVEERLFHLALAIDEALAQTIDKYNQAIGQDDTYVIAQDALADLHKDLFLDAERRGDTQELLAQRRHVERLHRGRHQAMLDGWGTLSMTIVSGDAVDDDASVRVWSLVERGKRIVRGAEITVGKALSRGHLKLPMPMGSAVVEVVPGPSHGARATTTVPVTIGRQGAVSLTVRLPFTKDLAGGRFGFVYVPAGSFIAGGDEQSQNAGPRREVHLDDFFIATAPVTCIEYLEFLNAVSANDVERARRHVPRTKSDGGHLWEPDERCRYALKDTDADGNPVVPIAPVMGVSFDDAIAYAAWASERDGVAYRLPTEDEWEKAARGADGRFFPWGNGFDPTFCKMATSRPGRPQPEAVMSFATDVSVYGMHDAAGGIREWCDSYYDAARETRSLRGGAWYFNPSFCRVAFRHGYLPHIVFTNFGFRLAKSAR